jgi:hypothetical protein
MRMPSSTGARQWRAVLTDDDVAHYDARMRELAPPELAAWLHRHAAPST